MRIKRLAGWMFALTMAVLCIGPAFVEVEAGKRANRDGYGKNKSRDIGWSLHEGTDADGNDTMRMQIHAPSKNRRMKNHIARHFTPEELLYGPGDQSTVWQQAYEKRLNPRSGQYETPPDEGFGSGFGGGRRGARRSGVAYEREYEYEAEGVISDYCDGF